MTYKITAIRVLHNELGDRVIGVNRFSSVEPHVLGGALGGLLFVDRADDTRAFFIPSTNIQKIYLERCDDDDDAALVKQKQKTKKR